MLYRIVKRAVDFVGAFFGLMIFSPIMIVIALAIRLESEGSPIFRQKRVSSNGKVFGMYKFRSMYLDADARLLHTNPELLKKYRANNWKLPVDEDPRVTGVGRFIRKTSIDELPQFWNVLMGEMSLVGPRAFRPEELEEQIRKHPALKKYVEKMLTAKPGITGPWQVGGRNTVDFPDRVKMDAQYADTKSIGYDLLIIFKTPFKVLHQEGAV